MDLQIKKEKIAGSRVKLEVVIPQKEFAKYYKKALEKLSAEVEIPGFRPGRAPQKMVIEKLGETRIDSEALNLAISKSTYLALARENAIPIESPKIAVKQFEKGKDLIYILEVSILPEIILGDYKNVKIKKEEAKVTPEEIDKAIADLRRRMSTSVEKKDGLEKGDWAEIDFEGTVKGVKIDKLTSKKFPFVAGEVKFIPGFEEKLIGMKKGEEKEFELKLPNNGVEEELKNALVKFKVKLNELKAIKLSELNQEFAQKLGAKDLADLRARMETALKNQKELELNNKFKTDLIDEIAAKTKIEMPESLVNQEKERLLGEFSRQLGLSGMTVEQFLTGQKKTKEQLDKDFIIQAEKNVKIGLTIAEISKAESIEVMASEIEAEVERLIDTGVRQGIKKAGLVRSYESEEGKRYIENTIKNKKTIDRIAEINE